MTFSKPISSLPVLRRLPVLGNLAAFRRDRLAFLRSLAELGDIGIFYLGSYPVVFLNSESLVYEALVKNASVLEKSLMLTKYMRPFLGNGLLTASNAINKENRKLMAPLFQPRAISLYAETIVDYTQQQIQQWQDGQVIDVVEAMTSLTMRIITQTLFTTDIKHDTASIGASITTVLNYSSSIADTLIHIPYHWKTPTHRQVHAAQARLDGLIQQRIDDRRHTANLTDDLLSLLLQTRYEDGSPMPDSQIRDELMTLLVAGHETTAMALTWAWHLLSQHPIFYGRLRDEVCGVLGNRSPTIDDLPRLPYALNVFKESLRLFPPAYIIARKAYQALDLGDYHIPNGTALVISPYTIHRRPDYFPNPEQFNPERFVTDSIPRHAYIPFSAGPRNCIGNHFALMEGHLILACMAQRLTFEAIPEQRVIPHPSITLRSKNPIQLRVHQNSKG